MESHYYPTVAHQENLAKCNELDKSQKKKKKKNIKKKKLKSKRLSIIAELRYYFGSENVIQVARNRQGELNSVISLALQKRYINIT